MKFIAFISLCATLAASTPSGFPMTRLTGQFSGLGEPSKRLVDLRLRFFARPTGGHLIGEWRIQSVELDRGRFSVALDLTSLNRRLENQRVYVEIALRPVGKRYEPYTPVAPRRALQVDARLIRLVWDLRPDTDFGHSTTLEKPRMDASETNNSSGRQS